MQILIMNAKIVKTIVLPVILLPNAQRVVLLMY